MARDKPFISVIVPCGRPDRVGHTLGSLLAQTYEGQAEILVVTPDPKAMPEVDSNRVRVVAVKRLLAPGEMRNIGAAAARGEVYAFVDDDCVVPAEWLSVMVATLADEGRTGAVGCRVVSAGADFWGRCADYALFSPYQYRSRRVVDLGSAALAVRSRAYREVKGFDPELLASEDWDFSLRLTENNWACVFEPTVEVKHDHCRNTFAMIVAHAFRAGRRSGVTVQRRHVDGLSWLARLSVRMGSPWLYWLLILPYACAVTLAQASSFSRHDFKAFLYLPFVFAARLAYHLGVWLQLVVESGERA